MSGRRGNSFEGRQTDRDYYHKHQRLKGRSNYEEDDLRYSNKNYDKRHRESDNFDRNKSRDHSNGHELYEEDLVALKGWKELDSCGYRKDSRSTSQERDFLDYDSTESQDSTDRLACQEENKDSYHTEQPNNTVMVRGLPLHITENDLRQDILQHSLMPKDIRLIRWKDTGLSRGFAFIEFNSVEEAIQWMEEKQGYMVLQDQCKAPLHYSIQKDNPPDRLNSKGLQDWFCMKCCAYNFKKRNSCFKCSTSREDSMIDTDVKEATFHPTRTIMIRNLDVSSTEDSVLLVINSVCNLPIRSIRIARDPVNNMSQGICYVDMNNIIEAKRLYCLLVQASPVIDEKKVVISYYKLPAANATSVADNTTDTSVEFDSNKQIDLTQYSLKDVSQLAEYSASLYAKTPEEHSVYMKYYTEYYESKLKKDDEPNEKEVSVSSCTESQTAEQDSSSSVEKENTSNVCNPSPDISTYTYDESSGYYFDSNSGLYYDAYTRYYYNGQTGQFLIWDAEKQSLSVVNTANENKNHSNEDLKKKCIDKEKQDKVKVAKKIVKDMERWAKTLNQKKYTARATVSIPEPITTFSNKSLGSADAGYAVLDQLEHSISDPPRCFLMPYATSILNIANQVNSNLVPAYGGSSESDDELEDIMQEEKLHTDWDKLVCLLCKRQFPNKEVLLKHQKLSDLHKSNLNTWYRVRGLDPDDPKQRNKKYRDRAGERRQKFGELNPPHPNHLKEKYLKARSVIESISFDEPNRGGISSDNVGNKLLHKMGWQEGMGLGKKNQGRVSIIQAEQRTANAGLGHKSSSYQKLPGDTYKDCVKKTMFARYKEISEREAAL